MNSTWSETALVQASTPKKKIAIAPLTYQAPMGAETFSRTYPPGFTPDRPLRVLFLGQVILRKGIAAVIEAAKILSDYPIEFWIVGKLGIDPPADSPSNLNWMGSVPRSQVAHHYKAADLFLFPTLSDGFGLTQLEAQAWSLPIIASRFCGEVVKDQTNGLLLPEVSGEAIANALCIAFHHPEQLQYWADHAIDLNHFSLDQLYQRLRAFTLDLV